MSPQDLLEARRRQPFVPFRVHVADGSCYEVRHPEMLMTGTTFVIIGLTLPNQILPVYESTVVLDLNQITRLEPLPTLPTP